MLPGVTCLFRSTARSQCNGSNERHVLTMLRYYPTGALCNVRHEHSIAQNRPTDALCNVRTA